MLFYMKELFFYASIRKMATNKNRLGGNETNEKVKVSFRHINSRNIDLLEQRISEIRLEFGKDINVDVSYFLNRIIASTVLVFPSSSNISLKRLSKPWLTTAILNYIRIKSNYLKLFRLGVISKNMNNKYKNILTSVIRKVWSNYHNDVFLQCKGNIRKTWSFIKEISGNRIVNTLSSLLFLTIELLIHMLRWLKFSTTFSQLLLQTWLTICHLVMVYLLLQISYLTAILCSVNS